MAYSLTNRIAGDGRWSAFQHAIRRLELSPEEITRRVEQLFIPPAAPPAPEPGEATETAEKDREASSTINYA